MPTSDDHDRRLRVRCSSRTCSRDANRRCRYLPCRSRRARADSRCYGCRAGRRIGRRWVRRRRSARWNRFTGCPEGSVRLARMARGHRLGGRCHPTIRLAVRRYRTTSEAVGRPRELTPERAYVSLLALTAVNPATLITFAAVAVGRSPSEASSTLFAVALFAIGAFAASAVWQLLLTGGGNLLGRIFSTRRGQLAISACSAFLMLALSVGVLLR